MTPGHGTSRQPMMPAPDGLPVRSGSEADRLGRASPSPLTGLPKLAVRRRRWVVDITLTVTLLVSIVLEPSSIAVHSVVGLAFAVLAVLHLWQRRRWIASTIRRLARRRLPRTADRLTLAQNTSLWILGTVMTASGLWDWMEGPTRIRVHAISSVLFAAVVARHAWRRRSGLRRPRAHAGGKGPRSG
jgi:hypothetical protein